ncbi:MAG: OsmC family protein [Desulfurococcaceae archaeon]
MSSIQFKDIVVSVRGSWVKGKPPTYACFEAGKFQVCTDKGDGEAPRPMELLLVSLAGCMNVVGYTIAQAMGIVIESWEIDIEGAYSPERLYTGRGEKAGLKSIKVKLRVSSPNARGDLERWIKEVERRCPVAGTIIEPTPLEISLESK